MGRVEDAMRRAAEALPAEAVPGAEPAAFGPEEAFPAEKPAEKPAEGPPKPPARVVARPALSGAEERATSSPPPADTPQYSLQTTAKVTEAERRIRVQLVQAAQDLSRTNYGALSAEAQAQYDIARRFAQQAEEALKNRNLVFAGQLADKAAELAGILSNR